MQAFKQQIMELLRASENKVLALKGAWGVGKTYQWKIIADELREQHKYETIYISALSYSSLAQLRGALILDILYAIKPLTGKGVFERTKLLLKKLDDILPTKYRIGMELPDVLTSLRRVRDVLPSNVLVAIDDIERAENYEIFELLGLVDYLANELRFHVVLILNTDRMSKSNKDGWDKLKERFINIEVELKMNEAEASRIGLGVVSQSEGNLFVRKIQQLGISNIRVIQHIKRIYSVIQKEVGSENPDLLELIPSIVLLTALYMKAVENAPTVEFALNSLNHFGNPKKAAENPDWNEFLADYTLGAVDEFETDVLVPFISSGLLNLEALHLYKGELARRRLTNQAEEKNREFWRRRNWDRTFTTPQQLDWIQSFLGEVGFVAAGDATSLSAIAQELKDPSLADSIINKWLNHNRGRISELELNDFDDYAHDQNLHKLIHEEYEKRRKQLFPQLSLEEAITYIATHRSYSRRHQEPILNASVDDFTQLISEAGPETQRRLFGLFAGYLSGRVSGGEIASAKQRYVDAVKRILSRSESDRLKEILTRAFQAEKLDHLLQRE